MLDQKKVFECLSQHGVTYFTGVPDSYLNGFCNYALANCGDRNVITANEGNSVALAAGHYLATKEIPLVYMQNSGEGNAVNPLASLVDKNVYAIPMILLIGWRGQGRAPRLDSGLAPAQRNGRSAPPGSIRPRPVPAERQKHENPRNSQKRQDFQQRQAWFPSASDRTN